MKVLRFYVVVRGPGSHVTHGPVAERDVYRWRDLDIEGASVEFVDQDGTPIRFARSGVPS